MDFNSDCGDISSLKFAGDMALDEGGLSDTTITYEDQLEFWNGFSNAGNTLSDLRRDCRRELR